MNQRIIIVLFCIHLQGALAMNISFFEEFPSEETVQKAAELEFPATIYLAAHNLSDFYHWRERLQQVSSNGSTVVYWPLLEEDDGYWVSPYADPGAIDALFRTLQLREDQSPPGNDG